jgi:hypothetical protein
MKIFLGYPSERRTEAERVWRFLSELALNVWFDRKSLLPGHEWQREQDAAQSEADLIIHILSSELLSRAGEFQRELKTTIELARKRPIGDIFFIPIRIDDFPMTEELSKYNYIDLNKEDWKLRIAGSILTKFERLKEVAPKVLKEFIERASAAEGRVELQLSNSTEVDDFSASYFRYTLDSLYYELVNAEIAKMVLTGYFRGPALGEPFRWQEDGDVIKSQYSIQVEEFFRREQLISLRITHFGYSAGAAHGNFGISTLNFAGEPYGSFSLNYIMDSSLDNLTYLIRYVELNLKQQFLNERDEKTGNWPFLTNFDEFITDPDRGWKLLEDFNFSAGGAHFNFSPYTFMPYVYGSQEVRIAWADLEHRLTEEGRAMLRPLLPKESVT